MSTFEVNFNIHAFKTYICIAFDKLINAKECYKYQEQS